MTASSNSDTFNKSVPFLKGAIVVIAVLSYFTSNTIVSLPTLLDKPLYSMLNELKFDQNLDINDVKDINIKAVQSHLETLKSVLLFLSVASVIVCGLTRGIVSRTTLLVFGVVNCIALYLSVSISISTTDWCKLVTKVYDNRIENEKENFAKLSLSNAQNLVMNKQFDMIVSDYKYNQSNLSWFQTSMILIASMSAIEMVLSLGLFFINRTKKTVESKI